MSVIEQNWREITELLRIKNHVSSLAFKTFIEPLKVDRFEDGILYVMTDKNVDFISSKYTRDLENCIIDVTQTPCTVVFISESAPGVSSRQDTIDPVLLSKIREANLNKKYTFDTFVVGSNNNFAHAAAVAVAENPGEAYNPLFLYSGVGLGKTHLMHSIGRHILELDPTKKVLYVSSETFTNDLIESIRKGNAGNVVAMENFRNHYRDVDVLLVDDIQFIIGKESTQEEFFHTFNHLHMAGKQIVISSDQPPKNISTLEDRLKTRFEWGLIADIQKPAFETRMAILKKKIEIEHYDRYGFPDEVLEYIATNIESNIRELESSLNHIIAYAVLNKKPNHDVEITLPLAREAIRNIVANNRHTEISPELIIETVADYYDIPSEDIMSKKRDIDTAMPRQIIMYLCRKLTDAPLKEIGIAVGGKDHSTISYGIKKIETDIKTDDSLRKTIEVLEKKIRSM